MKGGWGGGSPPPKEANPKKSVSPVSGCNGRPLLGRKAGAFGVSAGVRDQ